MWIRSDGAFEGIVEQQLFFTAPGIIRERNRRYSDDEMLDRLKHLLKQHGHISGFIIDEVENMPASGSSRLRFGSLVLANCDSCRVS
jgi:hypothetical protein